jgi:hypothetical protein
MKNCQICGKRCQRTPSSQKFGRLLLQSSPDMRGNCHYPYLTLDQRISHGMWPLLMSCHLTMWMGWANWDIRQTIGLLGVAVVQREYLSTLTIGPQTHNCWILASFLRMRTIHQHHTRMLSTVSRRGERIVVSDP